MPSADVPRAISELFDRELTHEEAQRINILCKRLGIRPNDAMLQLVVLLVGYGGDYARIPGLVREAAREACEDAAKAAELEIQAQTAEIEAQAARVKTSIAQSVTSQQEKITEKVLSLADTLASSAKVKKMALWICGAVAVCFVSFGVFGGFMSHRGYEAGTAAGYAQARDEALLLKQRDAFWTSDLGKRVMDLQKSGRLQGILDFADSDIGKLVNEYGAEYVGRILGCKLPSWEIREGDNNVWACFPKDGFKIPESLIPEKSLLDKITGK